MAVLDMLDREIQVGNFVVYYNNIYQVQAVPVKNGYGQVRIMLIDPSRTTKPVKKYSREMCLIGEHEVTMWMLKRGYTR